MGELTTTTPVRPGASAGTVNIGTITPIKKSYLSPIQVMGFVPMHECGVNDCRKFPSLTCCDRNIVFGNVINNVADINSNYKNDWNTFYVDYQLYANAPTATATWTLEKCERNSDAIQECNEYWIGVAALTNNTYGVHIPLETFPTHKTYTAQWINWGKVLKAKGPGYYRVKCSMVYGAIATCFVSDEFWLRQFDCNLAHGTVKFESWKTGQIGSATQQGKIFNLCKITHYDSFRLKAFFGYLQPSEYLEVMQEYRNGKQKRIKDETIRKYKFNSNLLPGEYHKRLSVYMMMADETLVSDYNKNNSDYAINRIAIVKAGAYDITYHDKDWNRNPQASAEFKEGIQTIISSNCCSTTGVGGTR